jgi:uncharacterized protein (DUF433 family)
VIDKNNIQHSPVPTADEVLRQFLEFIQALADPTKLGFSSSDIKAAFARVFEPVTLESYFDFLDNGETIRIKGHRVGIDLIIERFKAGQTPAQIVADFDTIRLEDVYATLTYYLHHQDRLDAWLAKVRARVEEAIAQQEAHPTPVVERLRNLSRAAQDQDPAHRERQDSA